MKNEGRIRESSVTLGREKGGRRGMEMRAREERRARTMITDFARGGEKTEAD